MLLNLLEPLTNVPQKISYTKLGVLLSREVGHVNSVSLLSLHRKEELGIVGKQWAGLG